MSCRNRLIIITISILWFGLMCVPWVLAQSVEVHYEWSSVIALDDGSPIPEGEEVLYKVWVGPTKEDLSVRINALTVTTIRRADLKLTPNDVWIAVEAYSDERLGTMMQPVRLQPFLGVIEIQIKHILMP